MTMTTDIDDAMAPLAYALKALHEALVEAGFDPEAATAITASAVSGMLTTMLRGT